MSWFHEKIEVSVQPIVMKIAGGLTVAIGDGTWRYLAPTETWEDHFQLKEISEEDKVDYNLVKTFKVPSSSKNGSYIVTQRGDSYTCQCKGFSFRRKCRHIDDVKKGLYN
jgi:hypothetical protein